MLSLYDMSASNLSRHWGDNTQGGVVICINQLTSAIPNKNIYLTEPVCEHAEHVLKRLDGVSVIIIYRPFTFNSQIYLSTASNISYNLVGEWQIEYLWFYDGSKAEKQSCASIYIDSVDRRLS